MSSIIKQSKVVVETQEPYIVGNAIRKANEISSDYDTSDVEKTFMNKLEELSYKIEDAEKRYKDIVNESEKILFETNNEAEKILAEAKNDGHNQGYHEGKKKADEELLEAKQILQDEYDLMYKELLDEKNAFLKDTKNKIADIFNMAFKKVFENEVAHSNNLLNILIMKGLREVADEKEITIMLSEEDYNKFDREEFKKQLGSLYDDKIIKISFDRNISNASCIIETSIGYIDASLNHLARYISALIDNSIQETDEASSEMSDEN